MAPTQRMAFAISAGIMLLPAAAMAHPELEVKRACKVDLQRFGCDDDDTRKGRISAQIRACMKKQKPKSQVSHGCFEALLKAAVAADRTGLQSITNTFSYTGDLVQFQLPDVPGVPLQVQFDAMGGGGADSPLYDQANFVQIGTIPGGNGAEVSATVTPPTVGGLVMVYVGGKGPTPQFSYPPGENSLECNTATNVGGWGIGGLGGAGGRGSTFGSCGAGGGGASGVLLDGGLVLVAAGGGGAGGPGANPNVFFNNAGSGGDYGVNGGAGSNGTGSTGGAGGCGACATSAGANGQASSLLNFYGGGGGGGGAGAVDPNLQLTPGWGGGGGSSSDSGGGGGGAGGSLVGLIGHPTNVSMTEAPTNGNGEVTLTVIWGSSVGGGVPGPRKMRGAPQAGR